MVAHAAELVRFRIHNPSLLRLSRYGLAVCRSHIEVIHPCFYVCTSVRTTMLSKVAILSLAAAALATADPPSYTGGPPAYGGSPGWGDDKPDDHGDWSSSVAPSPPAYSPPTYEPSTPVEPTEHKPSSYGSSTSTWAEEPSHYPSST